MKKFSNISGQKITEEPKPEVKKINEQDLIKHKILELMEQFLVIRSYGPVDRHQRAGLIQIAGKEVFLEAIMNLFNTKSLKEQTKLLESLKSEITNWELLDNKVNEFSNKMTYYENSNQILIQKQNVLKLYNKYKDDSDFLLKMVDESCKKIKTSDIAEVRAISSEQLYLESKNEIFKLMANKFNTRLNQIKNN
jgi:hypothetical protein